MVRIPCFTRRMLALLACVHASAAPAPPPLPRQAEAAAAPAAFAQGDHGLRGDTDSGVITSQVITAGGQDFYQYFVNAWRDKEGGERYTLAIHERPSARWGSEIWIDFLQRRVFYAHLPPSRSAIKAISEEAADSTFQAVLQADVQRQLIRDADLGRDEF